MVDMKGMKEASFERKLLGHIFDLNEIMHNGIRVGSSGMKVKPRVEVQFWRWIVSAGSVMI